MARKWWTLIVVSAATFKLLFDISIVNVALPLIRQNLVGTFAERGGAANPLGVP